MVSPAVFHPVTPPSDRVSCPHLSQGPKLPTHALRGDSQEVENWTSPNTTHPGSIPVSSGRMCVVRVGGGRLGAPCLGNRAVCGVGVGDSPTGHCHPSLLPTMIPKSLQRNMYPLCFKMLLLAVTSKPPSILGLFFSHPGTSS